MDFNFDDSQIAVRDLARQCFARATLDPERVVGSPGTELEFAL